MPGGKVSRGFTPTPKSLGVSSRCARGFTLMETLVALTLFSVVITIGTDLFFTFQRVGKRTEALETLVASARFITERFASEVRAGTIDYTRYAVPISGQQTALYLRDAGGAPVDFVYDEDGDTLSLTIPTGSESLVSSGVRLRDAAFYITPSDDPFRFDLILGDFNADIQPRVTVFLSFDNNLAQNDTNYTRYDVQTTITSRTYRR